MYISVFLKDSDDAGESQNIEVPMSRACHIQIGSHSASYNICHLYISLSPWAVCSVSHVDIPAVGL